MKMTQKQIARIIAIRKAVQTRQAAPKTEVTMDPAVLAACLGASGHAEHAASRAA